MGKRLAEKIYEIAESGSLQKLEWLQSSDHLQHVQLFMRIWGVGAETANLWASQVGIRIGSNLTRNIDWPGRMVTGLGFGNF